MGGKIDRVVGWAALTIAVFIFFLWASGSLIAASVMAALFVLCARPIVHRLTGRTHARRANLRAADAQVERWIGGDPTQSTLEAALVVAEAYALPEPTMQNDSVLCHDGARWVRFALARRPRGVPAFDALDALRYYDAARGEAALVIITTGKVAPEVLAFAEGLRDPQMRVIDGEALRSALAKRPQQPSVPESVKKNRKAAWLRTLRMAIQHVRPARYIRYAFVLLGMYILMGVTAYLPLALGLIALAILRMKKAPERQALFE